MALTEWRWQRRASMGRRLRVRDTSWAAPSAQSATCISSIGPSEQEASALRAPLSSNKEAGLAAARGHASLAAAQCSERKSGPPNFDTPRNPTSFLFCDSSLSRRPCLTAAAHADLVSECRAHVRATHGTAPASRARTLCGRTSGRVYRSRRGDIGGPALVPCSLPFSLWQGDSHGIDESYGTIRGSRPRYRARIEMRLRHRRPPPKFAGPLHSGCSAAAPSACDRPLLGARD